MKKTLLIIAVIAISALTSCKKTYSCTCTTSSNMQGFMPTTVTVTDAKEKCAGESTSTAGGMSITTKCVSK